MMSVMLAAALAIDPAAALGVIAVGFVLLLILRPIRVRSKQANRDVSKATRAMATRVTEYTRWAGTSDCSVWRTASWTRSTG